MKKIDIEQEVKKFDGLIETLPEGRKQQILNMMSVISERYFTVPASSNENKHDAFPGGLVSHSLKVTKNFKILCDILDPSIPNETIIVCGLFHDLGKIGDIQGLPMYVPVAEQWKLDRGQKYDYNKLLKDGLTHAQRSLRILTFFKVDLSDSEYFAILSHDGMFLEENQKQLKSARQMLPFLLHTADYYTLLKEYV